MRPPALEIPATQIRDLDGHAATPRAIIQPPQNQRGGETSQSGDCRRENEVTVRASIEATTGLK